MNTTHWIDFIQSGKADGTLTALYGREAIPAQRVRYRRLSDRFMQTFGDGDTALFSTPGRTEIGGNHTDHNQGRVLAGAVNLDAIAAARATVGSVVNLHSEGFPALRVDLADRTVQEDEKGATAALVRGVASGLAKGRYSIGGFDAVMASDVLTGSGLSSSAAVEVLIGSIWNGLYNGDRIPAVELARIGQYAENVYFGKPCGLMDQCACAVGGIVTIDFEDPADARVEKVDFDFAAQPYALCVVDTGGDHADLTADYAAIPAEMKAVAQALGETVCRPLNFDRIQSHMATLRETTGDRAVLRTLHFIDDNARVVRQVKALQQGDFTRFLALVRESGLSSHRWLQNVAPGHHTHAQPIALALALAERFIDGIGEGAARVHGGGFAGTIQVFLPKDQVAAFQTFMAPAFGPDAVLPLSIRPLGAFHWPETY